MSIARRVPFRLFFLSVSSVSALAAVACGHSSPTTPSTPSPRPQAASIRLVESSPPSGSRIEIELSTSGSRQPPLSTRGVALTFEVAPGALSTPALFSVELRLGSEEGNRVCARGSAMALPVAGQGTRVSITSFEVGSADCPFPGAQAQVTTVAIHATVGMLEADFPASYTFQVAQGPVATTPVITELCWDAIGIPTGYCQETPLEDDLMRYWCIVSDDDGDALEVSLSFKTKSGCATPSQCWSKSRTFAARSAPSTVRLDSDTVGFPQGSGREITCRAVDSHGLRAEKTFCLEPGGWPSPGPCP